MLKSFCADGNVDICYGTPADLHMARATEELNFQLIESQRVHLWCYQKGGAWRGAV